MIDWDDAFDNSGYVAGSAALKEQWAQDAARMRVLLVAEGRAQLDVKYGNGPREAYDLFSPNQSDKGTVIFVHGGYWHMLDKSYWSHFANGCLENGWAFAVPSYPLAPDVRIADITAAIAQAICEISGKTKGSIVLAGHSAGGHLIARMMCETVLPSEVSERITHSVAISGVYHLNPLLATKMNATLHLTDEEALAESPVNLNPIPDAKITFWVGDQERPEFLRQTRMATERWSAKSSNIHSVYEPGTNHFSVLQTLSDPNGALTQEILK